MATKASGSFGVKDVLGGGLEVSGEISNTVTQSYAETFTMSKTETYEANVPAGIVWQWKFNISDPCVPNDLACVDPMPDPNLYV